MTTYKSPFATYEASYGKWTLDEEPASAPAEYVHDKGEEPDDLLAPSSATRVGPALEYGDSPDFGFKIPKVQIKDGARTPVLIVRANKLKPNDVMVWTETDGPVLTGLRIIKPLVGNTLVIRREDERDPFSWRIRSDTRVGILDLTPKFNEWGEESL